LLLSVVFAYIYILQGSVKHIYPVVGYIIIINHIIANFLQCASERI